MTDAVRSAWTHALGEARRCGRAIAPLREAELTLSIDEAYCVQQQLVDEEVARGEVVAGYKMGLTSAAKQQAMGVSEPIYGQLYRSMMRSPEASLDLGAFIHPRIEPEVAVVLDQALRGPDLTEADVIQAVRVVVPVLEVIDSRYQDFRFTLPDVIADNASAAAVIIGSTMVPPEEVDWVAAGVRLHKNGELVQGAATAAVLGHPARAVMRLAALLAARDREIPAGSLILTGAITDAVAMGAGDVFLAKWQGIGTMQVRCV